MIRKIEFIKIRDDFQDKLKQDLVTIRSKNVLAFAEKSTNLYQPSKESYEKLLHNYITNIQKSTCEHKTEERLRIKEIH